MVRVFGSWESQKAVSSTVARQEPSDSAYVTHYEAGVGAVLPTEGLSISGPVKAWVFQKHFRSQECRSTLPKTLPRKARPASRCCAAVRRRTLGNRAVCEVSACLTSVRAGSSCEDLVAILTGSLSGAVYCLVSSPKTEMSHQDLLPYGPP